VQRRGRDRVGYSDDGRQRGVDHVVAELCLPLRPHTTVSERDLRRLRDDGAPQAVGDRGPEHRAVRVARLLAEKNEIGIFAFDDGRDGVTRRDEIGTGGVVVCHQDGPVCAHREPPPQRFGRLLRPQRDQHDLALAGRLLDLQSLLDRVDVERV
jgi:hypothetical protein